MLRGLSAATPSFRAIALAAPALLAIACGDARPQPLAPQPSATTASVAPASSVGDDADAKTELTRARARVLGAAAATWRRASGTCPTPQQLSDKYAFAPDTDVDAWGRPFSIACTPDAITITGGGPSGAGSEIAHTEPFVPAPAPPASERPVPTPPPPEDETAARFRAHVIPKLKRCYEAALKADPTISGALDLTLTVAQDGAVKGAVVNGSSPASVRNCVAKALVGQKIFPASDQKGDRVIHYP